MTRFRDRYRYPTNQPPNPGDTAAMRHAIERLLAAKIQFHRANKIQLKIDDLSFWPNTGTIRRDGGAARRERGIEALIWLLRPHQRSHDAEPVPIFEFLIDPK